MASAMKESARGKGAPQTNGGVLTAEDAKKRIYEKGLTLKQFATLKGFAYRTVSDVVRGVNKGMYGEGHRVAVALGMKRG